MKPRQFWIFCFVFVILAGCVQTRPADRFRRQRTGPRCVRIERCTIIGTREQIHDLLLDLFGDGTLAAEFRATRFVIVDEPISGEPLQLTGTRRRRSGIARSPMSNLKPDS